MRVCAWITIAVVAWLSLVPDVMAIRTRLPGPVEHGLAYFFTGSVVAAAYPSRLLWSGTALVGAAGLFEALQGFSPGRGPRLADLGASTIGALVGIVLIAWIYRRFIGRVALSPPKGTLRNRHR